MAVKPFVHLPFIIMFYGESLRRYTGRTEDDELGSSHARETN